MTLLRPWNINMNIVKAMLFQSGKIANMLQPSSFPKEF